MSKPSSMIFSNASTGCGVGKATNKYRSLIFVGVVCITLGILFTIVLQNEFKIQKWTNNNIQKSDTDILFNPDEFVSKFAASNEDDEVLNVHVVAHTHDDVGWLKTVEQYYFGLNNSIQEAAVQDILDNVVQSLSDNPQRTFTYVEQKFFSMWWERQTDAMKDTVRFLIANQQLGFVNGGWCMHDEAATHYMGMIDQTTLGHSFLLKELGVIPKVGWQLDPFGHSATQSSFMTSKMGFDALYFGRIDYQDLQLRKLYSECEGVWNSTSNLANAEIFWGLTGSYGGNYGAPGGYCFDMYCDDPSLIGMDREELSRSIYGFLHKLSTQAYQTKGNHIMLTMGSDFQYQRAAMNYANLDLLIGTIMGSQQWKKIDMKTIFGPRFDRINIFYSSPEYYTKCKYEQTKAMRTKTESSQNSNLESSLWTVKTDDFFPYSDCSDCFWTGYFTSRTAFKRLERVASSFLLAARQIDTMYGGTETELKCEEPMHELEDALGVSQHHDAVSGTAKQHVALDYARRLQAGINRVATECTAAKLRVLLLGTDQSEYLQDLGHCQLLNETICQISQDATKDIEDIDTAVYVVIYNPLAYTQSSIIRIPVTLNATYGLSRLAGGEELFVDYIQAVESFDSSSSSSSSGAADFVVMFDSDEIPPIGNLLYRISIINVTEAWNGPPGSYTSPTTMRDASLVTRELTDATETETVVSNDIFSATFDSQTGEIKKFTKGDETLEIEQTWGYYTSYDQNFDGRDDDNHNSGAYIFRPSVPYQSLHTLTPVQVEFRTVNVGTEVHVSYDEPWVKSVTRILTGTPYIEFEYVVGPVPIDDGRGKEIVSKWSSPIKSAGTFYTDSNGREFIERIRDYRSTWNLDVYQPIAGNYYPVNAGIYIEDEDASLAIVVDRSVGGASITDGSIELMVQRRILNDDNRGVTEPLNETDGYVTPYPPYGNAERVGEGVIVKGKHRIFVGSGLSGAKMARSAMDAAFAEPVIFVGTADRYVDIPFTAPNFSGLNTPLPENLMLITMKDLNDDPSQSSKTLLVRIGHQYGYGEDENLSQPVSIDLSQMFKKYNVVSVVEKTLSGNQDYASWLQRRMDWTGSSLGTENKANTILHDDSDTVFTINPMEIRTFEVVVSYE